jgi:DNA adenine methylase
MLPFLKWPGGKRWFVLNCAHLLPSSFARYFEPFLGAGSVFFHLKPQNALLGDTNQELIAVYKGMRRSWRQLHNALARHQELHSSQHYYAVRAATPTNLIERAARTLYLNRTCFNGIYRVNLKGQFNVPRGTKNAVLLDNDDFRGVARLLRVAQIYPTDFESLIDQAMDNDLVFADPPYTVRHNFNGFIKYNERLFTWNDQERLALALHRARGRGAKVVCTNANHPSIRDLYGSLGFHLVDVSRYSSIAATPSSRRQFCELVAVSDLRTGERA